MRSFMEEAGSNAISNGPGVDLPGFKWCLPGVQQHRSEGGAPGEGARLHLPGGIQLALPGPSPGPSEPGPSEPAEKPSAPPSQQPSPSTSPITSPPHGALGPSTALAWPPMQDSGTKVLSMSELTKKIQQDVMGAGDVIKDKNAAAETGGETDDAAPTTQKIRPAAKKRPAKNPKKPMRAHPNTKKGKNTAKKGKNTAKGKKRPAAKVVSKTDHAFEYRTAKEFNTPRYYGGKTLYTDTIRQVWRIKPGKGRRDHKMFSFKTNPRETWNEVVKALKKL